MPAHIASGRERFRRHADGGDDQSYGRRRVGDRDDAGAVRRRDPRDRSHPGGAHDDLRAGRHRRRNAFKGPYRSTSLTVSVNQIDRAETSPKRLRRDDRPATIAVELEPEDEGEAEIPPTNPLSSGRIFLQNHTRVISGGVEECTTTSLGKSEHGVATTTRRSSSPRREAHRGRRRGSAASVPFASSASTTRSGAMNATACGGA